MRFAAFALAVFPEVTVFAANAALEFKPVARLGYYDARAHTRSDGYQSSAIAFGPAGSGLLAGTSQRFIGGPDFRKDWPRDELPILSRTDRVELQTLLAQRKYDVGEADGVIGRRMREAIRAYQRTAGMTPDGFATIVLLQSLRQSPPT